MAKIMIQGTGSSVGKSILVAALCRIFSNDGYRVAPFKSQNMSLNSYITLEGHEMGRAQVLQAYASRLEPEVYMNPILLKPTSDKKCQIILNGEVYGNSSAMEYHNLKLEFKDMLKSQFEELEQKFDIIVMEGAGSPAEINLRDRDIVNMGMAELVDAPVLLVGDIDKGGVFASLAGTMLLLKNQEKPRVKGTIINKFRGDIEILKPGLTMLEDIIGIPCLGVVPYFDLSLEDEDGAIELNKIAKAPIDIAVIKLPRISNFTDFDAFKLEEDVSVRYVRSLDELSNPDLIIIPGTKNTIDDLKAIKDNGLMDGIISLSKDTRIIGICGGYQMLGTHISDPEGIESCESEIEGMGLLPVTTQIKSSKVKTRVEGGIDNSIKVKGYEIHMGVSNAFTKLKELVNISLKNNKPDHYTDGAISDNGRIIGTYIHGIFDSKDVREWLLNPIRIEKSIPIRQSKDYEDHRDKELDRLADIVRESIDMDEIYRIVGQK